MFKKTHPQYKLEVFTNLGAVAILSEVEIITPENIQVLAILEFERKFQQYIKEKIDTFITQAKTSTNSKYNKKYKSELKKIFKTLLNEYQTYIQNGQINPTPFMRAIIYCQATNWDSATDLEKLKTKLYTIFSIPLKRF